MPQYDTSSIFDNTIVRSNSFTLGQVWVIVSVLLAVIGGVLIYSNYLSKDKEDKYTGNQKKIYDFFNFKITIIEPIFRLLYVVCTIALTLGSFSLIGKNFFEFIGTLVFGNLALRLCFEFVLLIFNMFNNIDMINRKMPGKPKKESTEKKSKEVEETSKN